jgi:small-conductance mechanosensitive channel
MHSGRKALLLAAFMALLLIALPLFSEGAEGQGINEEAEDVIIWSAPHTDTIDLRAGETKTLTLRLSNTAVPALPADDGVRYVDFYDTGSATDRFTVKIQDEEGKNISSIRIDPGDTVTVLLEITAAQYSGSVRDITAEFELMVYYLNFVTGVVKEESVTLKLTIHISSGRASENQYNKIMGVMNNPFPSPFDTAIYAAAVTMLIWLGIAFLAAFVILPKMVGVLLRKHGKEDRNSLVKKIKKELLLILVLYGFTASVAVTGVSEYVIQTVETISYVIYILIGMQIAWSVFVAVMDMLHKKKKSDAEDEDEPDDSMRPLISMIFKIIMGMIATGLILGVLGLDAMFIATGAGIVGLAISFGAQSTLSQFFSGFTLLLNRPLRPGDLVRIGTSPDTLRVVNIGFMMTTFRNWANSEIITMPNQMVVSSTIINVTAESDTYRIIVLVKVPYTSDVMLAKALALEAMREHPRILQDGTEEIPKARFEEFSDSSLTISVSGFVDDFEDHRSIAGEIRESIFRKYKENDVTIAIPKMDVYIKQSGTDKEERY